MHNWNDDWPHWDTLYTAEQWIRNEMGKTDAYLMCKEKYGTIRYEHIIRHPPEQIEPEPQIWDEREDWEALWVIVQRAVNRWPELEDELLNDMACNEEIVGKEIHDRYWTTYTGG